MTREEMQDAINDLCDAETEEQAAREVVRKAGDNLSEVSARRDALAAIVAPIIRANRGKACKGRAWNSLMVRHESRVISIDEHGCVVVEPLIDVCEMVIPAEACGQPAPNALTVDLADTMGMGDDLGIDDGEPSELVAMAKGA